MELVPKAATWSLEHIWVLNTACSVYTVLYDFTSTSRNIPPYWEISWRLEKADVHWTMSQECMKDLRLLNQSDGQLLGERA